jgi:hypothetical protein
VWCIHAAIELEKRGLPVTLVCTSNTASLAKQTLEGKGFPEMPLVAVPHPIAGNDDETIRRKADDATDELISVLASSSEGPPEDRAAAKGTKASGR